MDIWATKGWSPIIGKSFMSPIFLIVMEFPYIEPRFSESGSHGELLSLPGTRSLKLISNLERELKLELWPVVRVLNWQNFSTLLTSILNRIRILEQNEVQCLRPTVRTKITVRKVLNA